MKLKWLLAIFIYFFATNLNFAVIHSTVSSMPIERTITYSAAKKVDIIKGKTPPVKAYQQKKWGARWFLWSLLLLLLSYSVGFLLANAALPTDDETLLSIIIAICIISLISSVVGLFRWIYEAIRGSSSSPDRGHYEATNIKFENKGSLFYITYDIFNSSDVKKFDVIIKYSLDEGRSWHPLSARASSGDIGENIRAGNRKFVKWDVEKDDSISNDTHISIISFNVQLFPH